MMSDADYVGGEFDQLIFPRINQIKYKVNRIGHGSLFELLCCEKKGDTIIIDFIGSEKPFFKLSSGSKKEYWFESHKPLHSTSNMGGSLIEECVDPILEVQSVLDSEVIRDLFDVLKKYKKIVLIEPKRPYEYVDLHFRINILKEVDKLARYEAYYKTLYELISLKFECITIPAFEDLILYERNNPHQITYTHTYLSYLSEAIDCAILDSKDVLEIVNKYSSDISDELYRPLYNPMFDQIKFNYAGRRIVICGKCDSFKKLLISKYSLDVEITEVADIKKIPKKLLSKEKNYWVFPQLTDASHIIIRDFVGMKYYRIRDYCLPLHVYPFRLEKFVGNYKDHYNNFVFSSSPVDIIFYGCGNNIVNASSDLQQLSISQIYLCNMRIGEKTKITGTVQMMFASSAIIGDSTVNTGSTEFFILDFNELSVGSDCLIGKGVQFQCGDGHPIFDIPTAECINMGVSSNFDHKNKTTIGNHVWIGTRATILSKSKVGSGSVVGACSIVNKVFPNNCVIAGNPAHIIRRDIAWNRSPVYELYPPVNAIDPQYIKMTEDLQ